MLMHIERPATLKELINPMEDLRVTTGQSDSLRRLNIKLDVNTTARLLRGHVIRMFVGLDWTVVF